MSGRLAWALRLGAIPAADPAKLRSLWTGLGPEGLERGDERAWSEASGIGAEAAARWRREALAFDAEGEIRRLDALGATTIALGDAHYPDLLGMLWDAPVALHCLGRLEPRPPLAFVGARSPTPYGLRQARRLAGACAREGAVIVSGLARGIDAAAHEAALDEGGTTWAVLGSGLGDPYPPENVRLLERIVASGGCVLSEFPVLAPPLRENFPRRNRIVAGLSWAVVVVEGRNKSGSRITADQALGYGRPVLAVPGPADSPLSEAPHELLRSGAAIAAEPADILTSLPLELRPLPASPRRPQGVLFPGLEAGEKAILTALGPDSLSLEELLPRTGLDMPRLSTIMFGLEIKELVCAVPGQRYAQKDR